MKKSNSKWKEYCVKATEHTKRSMIQGLNNIIRKESWDFLGGTLVKNPPANPGDVDLIPGLGTKGWTGRPGVLQSMGSQRIGHDRETELT